MEVGADFMLVVALSLYLDKQGVVMAALMACTLHEMGHFLALYSMGGRLRILRLSCVGAEMAVESQLGYGGEVVLAISGPLVNLVVAVTLSWLGIDPLFCGINLTLGLLNLCPAQRLDGGRAVYSLCCMVFSEDVAQRVEWGCNICVTLLLLTFGCGTLALGGSFTLLVLAIWILWTGKIEVGRKKTLA